MASQRYVVILKNGGGVTDKAAPIAYVNYADALAAAVADGPAGGYLIVDSTQMDRVLINTTVITYDAKTYRGVNDHSTKNYLGVASETWPS